MVEITGNEDLLRENQAEPSGCVTVIMAAAGMEKMLPWNPFGLLCFEAVFAEGLGAQDRPFREEQLGPSASSCCRTPQWELSGFFTRYLGKQNSSCQHSLQRQKHRDKVQLRLGSSLSLMPFLSGVLCLPQHIRHSQHPGQ